jgi:hypothetical protein
MTKQIVEVDNVEKELINLSNILNKLRAATKEWEIKYGFATRQTKKYWESKADEWLINHIKKIEP